MMNARQERFCEEYVIDFNATQAAIKAGYSEKTAYSIGQRLLKDVEVAKRIAESKEKASELCTMTKQALLDRLEELTQSEKDSDAIRATEIYMKHRGMLDDRSKIEHTGKGFTIAIEPREETPNK